MKQPLFSCVIPVKGDRPFFGEAIDSLKAQGLGDELEIIVQDGTTEYTEYTENDLRGVRWYREEDCGQSDALNKGFAKAKGEWLFWLNADDVLMPGTLKAFEKAVVAHPDCKWFVGGALWLDKQVRVLKCGCGRKFSIARANMGNVHVWGPSSFFSRDLYEQVGGVDERFHYMMDTDLWSKFYHKCHVVYMPFVDYAWGLRLHEQAKMSAHNFAESGQADPSHPKWAQIAREGEMIADEVYAPKYKMNLMRKITTVNIVKALQSRFDTLRFRGKDYRDCVK